MKIKLTSVIIAGVVALVSTICTASALELNLTTAGASGTINGAFFQQVPDQSTGTGVIDPFLRIQRNGTEEGFNNSVEKIVTLDNVSQGNQTYVHDIRVSDIQTKVLNGVTYGEFLLDINEDSGSNHELLSLYQLELWVKTGPITSITDLQGNRDGLHSDLSDSPGATKVWDLDDPLNGQPVVDNFIELDYSLNSGSGSGDMFAYIPMSLFGNDPNKFVYLYSAFGTPSSSSDGFEEWAFVYQPGDTRLPDGGTSAMLFGLGLAALAGIRMRLHI